MEKHIKTACFKAHRTIFMVGVMIMFIGIILPICSGSLGVFEKDKCVNIKTILNTTSVNISTISYPNSTIAEFNKEMSKIGQTFNYSYCNTSDLGIYIYDYFDAAGNVYVNDFEITSNGNPSPSESVIVFFSIGFLIVIGFLSYLMIYNLGHFAQMDYDLGDLIKNVSAYFVLLGLYLLSLFYMGNEMINNIMVWIIGITGFTNVGMSFLFFIICFIAKRKVKIENAW